VIQRPGVCKEGFSHSKAVGTGGYSTCPPGAPTCASGGGALEGSFSPSVGQLIVGTHR